MDSGAADGEATFQLTDEHRMLLQIRDTLYEGSWEDFLRDLRARAAGRPHVFELLPPTAAVKATIAHHVELIERMREWELEHGGTLRAGSEGSCG